MGFKCGCGAEYDNQKSLVAHMIDAHSSPFVSGDEKLIKLSVRLAKEKNNSDALRKLREADILDENNKEVSYYIKWE